MACETGRSARSRAPGGFLGMLVLIAVAEAAIHRRERDDLAPGAWDFRQTSRLAASRARGRDVLGFGDSLLKLAMIPRVLERESGLRAYNLAISGSQTPLSYFLLRRVLRAGARPRAVVLECAPALLRLGPGHNLDNWPHALTPAEAAELAWTARDPDLFARVATGHLLGSVRNRLGLRAAIARALDDAADPARVETRAYRRNWERNDGAQVMAENPGLREYPLDVETWRRQFNPGWEGHPVNLAYLRRFLDLAAREGIAVYWVVPPILPALQDACDRGGFAAQQTRFLHALLDRYPNLRVVDGRGAGYDPGVFHDPNHLGRDGAYTFSVELARVLAGPPARWAELPRYVARAADAEIHDVPRTMALQLPRGGSPRRR